MIILPVIQLVKCQPSHAKSANCTFVDSTPSFSHPYLVSVGNACSQGTAVQLGALSSISRGQTKGGTTLRLYQTWKVITHQLLGKET